MEIKISTLSGGLSYQSHIKIHQVNLLWMWNVQTDAASQ